MGRPVTGGGPAGAAAAVYTARKGVRTGVVAERFGGQVLDTNGDGKITRPWNVLATARGGEDSVLYAGDTTNDGNKGGDNPDNGAKVEDLNELLKQTSSNVGWFLQNFSVERLDDLTRKQREEMKAMLLAMAVRRSAVIRLM